MGALDTTQMILRYSGLFNFDELYHVIVGFFKRKNYDYIEKGWKEKDATPEGREITVKMIPEKRVAENIMYNYKITWLSIDAHPVDVISNGKPVTLTHARFSITISASVNPDYQELGEKHEKLSSFITKNVMDKELRSHRDTLEQEIQELLDEIKKYLHMETSKED